MKQDEKQEKLRAKAENLLRSRMEGIGEIWKNECEGTESEEYGPLNEYGLSFDYVEGKTEYNDGPGYYRYQISWGGPSEEFRFFCDPGDKCYSIVFAYRDWFCGEDIELRGEDRELMMEVFYDWFVESGATSQAVFDARE